MSRTDDLDDDLVPDDPTPQTENVRDGVDPKEHNAQVNPIQGGTSVTSETKTTTSETKTSTATKGPKGPNAAPDPVDTPAQATMDANGAREQAQIKANEERFEYRQSHTSEEANDHFAEKKK